MGVSNIFNPASLCLLKSNLHQTQRPIRSFEGNQKELIMATSSSSPSTVPVEHVNQKLSGDSFIRPHLRKLSPYQPILPFEVIGRNPISVSFLLPPLLSHCSVWLSNYFNILTWLIHYGFLLIHVVWQLTWLIHYFNIISFLYASHVNQFVGFYFLFIESGLCFLGFVSKTGKKAWGYHQIRCEWKSLWSTSGGRWPSYFIFCSHNASMKEVKRKFISVEFDLCFWSVPIAGTILAIE